MLALIEPLAVNRVGPRPNVRGLRSFPSGHAWNTFALATVLVLWFRRWGWLAYMPAAAVALSRVHAGLHWPSDIAASAILSVPVTVLLSFGLNAAWKRCIVPRCPRVGAAVPSLLPERDEA